MTPIDLTGQKFNRLLVLSLSAKTYRSSRQKLWDCLCDCGELRTVSADGLRSGTTKSCGCYRREYTIQTIAHRERKKDGTLAKPGQGDPDIACVPKMSGVYLITCATNGRVYVGSSLNLRYRWWGHKKAARAGSHHSAKFQASWNKYGESSFSFSILEFVDKDSLLVAEQKWIDTLGAATQSRGMNIRPTAGSPLGVKHSEEARRKASEIRRGKPKSQAWRDAIGRALIGKKFSAERRAAISASKLGHKPSEETRRKWSEARKGRPGTKHTEASRAAMRAGHARRREAVARRILPGGGQ